LEQKAALGIVARNSRNLLSQLGQYYYYYYYFRQEVLRSVMFVGVFVSVFVRSLFRIRLPAAMAGERRAALRESGVARVRLADICALGALFL